MEGGRQTSHHVDEWALKVTILICMWKICWSKRIFKDLLFLSILGMKKPNKKFNIFIDVHFQRVRIAKYEAMICAFVIGLRKQLKNILTLNKEILFLLNQFFNFQKTIVTFMRIILICCVKEFNKMQCHSCN